MVVGDKKLKIAFLSLAYGRANRGAETFVSELSKRLGKNNEVDIISSGTNYFPLWPIVWRLFVDPQGLQVLWFTIRSLPKIVRNKYDIVIPIDGGWQPFLVRLFTWLYGGKMIVSGQSGVGWHDRFNLWCLPNVFVSISTRALKWAGEVNARIKSIYIPNGVDLEKFNPKVGTTYSTKLSKPIILCVGALEKSKGIDLVIKAVTRLKDASLLIVGKGKEKENLRDLAEKVLKDRFEIVSLDFDKMSNVYRACDLFALTSNEREAFGIVYVEAMASGLPVVARNDEQRREIVGDAGVLVNNPENITELAGAMEKALSQDWGDLPRKQAEKFSWDEIARKYDELFNVLVR